MASAATAGITALTVTVADDDWNTGDVSAQAALWTAVGAGTQAVAFWRIVGSAFSSSRRLLGLLVKANGCGLQPAGATADEGNKFMVANALARMAIPDTACGVLTDTAFVGKPMVWSSMHQSATLAWLHEHLKVTADAHGGSGPPTAATMRGSVVGPDQISLVIHSEMYTKVRDALDNPAVKIGALHALISGRKLSATQQSTLFGLLTHTPRTVQPLALTGEAAAAAAKTDSGLWNKLMVDLKVRLREQIYELLIKQRGPIRDTHYDRAHMNEVIDLVVRLDVDIFGKELWRFSPEPTIVKAAGKTRPQDNTLCYRDAVNTAVLCLREVYGLKIGADPAAVGARLASYVEQYRMVCSHCRSFKGGADGIFANVPGRVLEKFVKSLTEERDTGHEVSGVLQEMLVPAQIQADHASATRRYFASFAELQEQREAGNMYEYRSPEELQRLMTGVVDWRESKGGKQRGKRGAVADDELACGVCGEGHKTANHDRAAKRKSKGSPGKGGRPGSPALCNDFGRGTCTRGNSCKYVHAVGQGGQGASGPGTTGGMHLLDPNRVRFPGVPAGYLAQGVCFAHQKGSCTRGSSCKFSHETATDGGNDVCRDFVRGACTRGGACRFSHGQAPQGGAARGAAQQPPGGKLQPLGTQGDDVKQAYTAGMRLLHAKVAASGQPLSCLFMTFGKGSCRSGAECTKKSNRRTSHARDKQLPYADQVKLFEDNPEMQKLFWQEHNPAFEYFHALATPELVMEVKNMGIPPT